VKPLACKSLPSEEEIMPLPSEEVTPPVTNIYFEAVDIGRVKKFGGKGREMGFLSNPTL
jgi:hypothetical protein